MAPYKRSSVGSNPLGGRNLHGLDTVDQRGDLVACEMGDQITEERQAGHAGSVPLRRIGDSPFGFHRGHVVFGQSRLDQDVGAIDSRYREDTQRGLPHRAIVFVRPDPRTPPVAHLGPSRRERRRDCRWPFEAPRIERRANSINSIVALSASTGSTTCSGK